MPGLMAGGTFADAEAATRFVTSVLEASTEYSIIAADIEGDDLEVSQRHDGGAVLTRFAVSDAGCGIGASITFESEFGEGSTFTLELPEAE
jgi:hypothetical protein